MNVIFYFLATSTLFFTSAFASEHGWMEKYPEYGKSRLYGVLTKTIDKTSMDVHAHSSTYFVTENENLTATREVLRDTKMTPFDLYNILAEPFLPSKHLVLLNNYYGRQRKLSGVPEEFNAFDVQFCRQLHTVQKLIKESKWDKLGMLSSKDEVLCEAAFFYKLIDFEDAIACMDSAPPAPLTCSVFSNFVADMYFGETRRPDLSYEDDIEGQKWLEEMREKYESGHHFHTASLMRRFTRNIRGEVDNRLWNGYMRAMMTVHLSNALLEIYENGVSDMYNYLSRNLIQDEYVFASTSRTPPQSGQMKGELHAFLRTFKLDPKGGTATMGIINSGSGIQFHDKSSFELISLPDTISSNQYNAMETRYIPFIIYEAVPRSEWSVAYTITNSMNEAYFGHSQKILRSGGYKKWQYIDNQRAGTCTAMSLWVALYWFEQESQQKLESFRLALYLEVLKEATKELHKLRTELEELDAKRPELVDDDLEWNKLQSKIKMKSDLEDDYLRFFSVAFNSAIRSIRYLHYDPFNQGLVMTAVMQNYATFYESQAGESYWTLVKPNIDDLYTSTYNRILNPDVPLTSSITPKISSKERDCANHVIQAIKTEDPFDFVKAVISGTEIKCQSKVFLESIAFYKGRLILQTHHQDLILSALIREIRQLHGGRTPILVLVEELITDHKFKLFPTYSVSSTKSIDFSKNVHQIFELEDDSEVQQFAVNCAAFESVAESLLRVTNDLIKAMKKSIAEDYGSKMKAETTEEYKFHKRFVHHISAELQKMDPHLYAQHLSRFITNIEHVGIAEHINSFTPSTEWNGDDYVLLEKAVQERGIHEGPIKTYIDGVSKSIKGRSLTLTPQPSVPTIVGPPPKVQVHKDDLGQTAKTKPRTKFAEAIASGVKGGYRKLVSLVRS